MARDAPADADHTPNVRGDERGLGGFDGRFGGAPDDERNVLGGNFLPGILYALVLVALALYLAVFYFDSQTRLGEIEAAAEIELRALDEDRDDARQANAASITVVLSGILAFTLVFGLFAGELMRGFPRAFSGIADGGTLGWGIAFAFDNLLHAMPINIETALGFSFSGIEPAKLPLKGVVFLFRFTVATIALRAVFRQWHIHRGLRDPVP